MNVRIARGQDAGCTARCSPSSPVDIETHADVDIGIADRDKRRHVELAGNRTVAVL